MSEKLYIRALKFALDAHAGQTDIHGHGYELHILRVMAGVSRAGVNHPEALAAAALHDTVEDCDVSLEEIEKRFGHGVATLVRFLTHFPGSTYRAYIENIDGNRIARTIKLADLEDNSLAWRVVPNGKKQKVYPAAIIRLRTGEWPVDSTENEGRR